MAARDLASKFEHSGVPQPSSTLDRLVGMFSGPRGASHCFSGAEFIQWAILDNAARDEAKAMELGQSLLDNRLARHVTDDEDFSPAGRFSLLAHEQDPQVRREHARLTHLIENQQGGGACGDVMWRNRDGDAFVRRFAVFDASSNKAILAYKRRSAAGPPESVVAGITTLREREGCLPDWYCFSVEGDSTATVCLDHSSKQEAWMQAIADASSSLGFVSNVNVEDEKVESSLFDFSVRKLDSANEYVKLGDEYSGKVCVVVNVASKCGLTRRDYTQLAQLREEYHARGFEVLAFPSNEFGQQEPGPERDIAPFAQREFGVRFPIFGKVVVNGQQGHPLFRFLRARLGGVLGSSSIKWNYTKFLCDAEGTPVRRYAPATPPLSMRADIERLLTKAAAARHRP